MKTRYVVILAAVLSLGCNFQRAQVAPTRIMRPVVTLTPAARDNLSVFSAILTGAKFGTIGSLLETADFGYLAAGVTVPGDAGVTDGYIVKLDKEGKIAKEYIYKLPGSQYFYTILPAGNSGWMVLGVQQSEGKANWDIYVVKLDAKFRQQWDKRFSGKGTAGCNEMIAARDGGYLVVGLTDVTDGAGNSDYYIIKLDKTGAVQWEKIYNTEKRDFARTAVETRDNGFLVAGFGDVKKLDSQGRELWSKPLGSGLPIQVNSSCETADGNYLFAGAAQVMLDANQSNTYIYAMCMNTDGDILWETTFNYKDRGYCFAQSIRKTYDGCYIISGGVQHRQDVGLDIALIKIDAAGKVLWNTSYDEQGGEYINITIPVSDGGYLSGGYATQRTIRDGKELYLGSNGCVFKFNSFGNMNK